MFSYIQNKWILFVSIDGHFQQIQLQYFKNNILNGKPIIGFYSVELLKAKQKWKFLFDLRKTDNILIKDMSMYFCDTWRNVVMRRKRLGVRPLMNRIYRYFHFRKPYKMLQQFQSFQLGYSSDQTKQLLKRQIPKSHLQFNLSDYYLTPSRVGKYHILNPQAQPIPNQQYNQQKIYFKDDLIPVCSHMGWIDFNRMVRENQEPLKKTQNKNKKPIQLYRYEQTEPYQIKMDNNGNFILDQQHNSIYVSPKLILPVGTCIIQEKVSYICNKYKYRFAKLVQGFVHAGGMRVLPNQIGYIIYTQDKNSILKLYQQRLAVLNKNKEQRKDQKIQKMWKQLFKYIKLVDRINLGI